MYNERVSAHWSLVEVGIRHIRVGKVTSVIVRAPDGLESVSVEMEGVLASVAVVHDNLDNLAFLQDETVRVGAVDQDVLGDVAAG